MSTPLPQLLRICHACDHNTFRRGCDAGRCACSASGRWYVEHVQEGACPEGRFALPQDRPAATAGQAATFARAALTGEYVSEAVKAERERICFQCAWRRIDAAGVPWCGACGCGVSDEERKLRNLAAYEEHLPHWGCKHPERAKGRGWPLPVLGTEGASSGNG